MFIRAKSLRFAREKHPVHTDALMVAAGHKRRARRRADGRRGVKGREPYARERQLVDVWAFVCRAAVAAEVAVTQVVAIYQDNVRLSIAQLALPFRKSVY